MQRVQQLRRSTQGFGPVARTRFAFSLTTNTNWQVRGESTMSYFTQWRAQYHNFVSAAILRSRSRLSADSRKGNGRVGNFWVDLT
jgi:K+-transporting ATPase A subunit